MARNGHHDLPKYFHYKNNMSHAFSDAEISCFATNYANLAIFMRFRAVRSRLAIATCIKQSIFMARNVQHDLPEYFQYKKIFPMLFLALKSVALPLTMQI